MSNTDMAVPTTVHFGTMPIAKKILPTAKSSLLEGNPTEITSPGNKVTEIIDCPYKESNASNPPPPSVRKKRRKNKQQPHKPVAHGDKIEWIKSVTVT